MKHLVYIFPSHLGHRGINVKVDGQLKELNKYFKVTVHSLSRKENPNIFSQFISLIAFELKSLHYILKADAFYFRYSPMSPLTWFLLRYISTRKIVIIEHNTKHENEFRFLEKNIHLFLHKLAYSHLKKSKAIQLCVNKELENTLKEEGFKHTLYVQNGYEKPIFSANKNHALIERCISLKKEYKLAIFTGNGYPWHGLKEILSLIEPHKNLKLIVVGPYHSLLESEQTVITGSLQQDILLELYNICDFAISTFRWDMLEINEGSPLKTREYLCNGLPILVNYKDSAEDFKELQPFVYNAKKDPNALSHIISDKHDHKLIESASSKKLSWQSLWKSTVISLIKNY
jgi:glycosyltransferase involved in cell wall biosynthesis